MKRSKLKKKFEKEYPKLKGVSVRYGISDDFFINFYSNNADLEYDALKRGMILQWIKEDSKEINVERTENVYINAMKNLSYEERIIFNMKCVDSFDYEEISKAIKIKKDSITNYYNKAKTKIKEDEKIATIIDDLVIV